MITLLLHHILVVPEKAEEADEVYRRAQAAGIKLQLDKREQAAVEYGKVVKVGPTAFKDYGRDPDILKEGDRISFAKYAGKAIKDEGIDYLLLNDQDVLCIMGEKE